MPKYGVLALSVQFIRQAAADSAYFGTFFGLSLVSCVIVVFFATVQHVPNMLYSRIVTHHRLFCHFLCPALDKLLCMDGKYFGA